MSLAPLSRDGVRVMNKITVLLEPAAAESEFILGNQEMSIWHYNDWE